MTVKAALVWCPFPDRATARALSDTLLAEQWIACANILGAVESVFQWDGQSQQSSEVPVLFKTTSDRLDRMIERLGELHPYDTPAIVGWHCDAAHPSTLEWLSSIGAGGRA
jgi:periplasmic divalent cation tolerance protein